MSILSSARTAIVGSYKLTHFFISFHFFLQIGSGYPSHGSKCSANCSWLCRCWYGSWDCCRCSSWYYRRGGGGCRSGSWCWGPGCCCGGDRGNSRLYCHWCFVELGIASDRPRYLVSERYGLRYLSRSTGHLFSGSVGPFHTRRGKGSDGSFGWSLQRLFRVRKRLQSAHAEFD
jgi:hypothetical protein